MSNELFSVISTWSLFEFILTTMIHDSNEKGDFGSDGQYLILVVKSFYKDKEALFLSRLQSQVGA